MRYRKLTANGDYSFGNGQGDFYNGIYATTQACVTRLQLWLETWWRDLTDGTPYMQRIIATPGNPENLAAISSILQGRILGTPGVTKVDNVSLVFTPGTRNMIFTATITTTDSTSTIRLEL